MAYSALGLNEIIQLTGLSKDELNELLAAGEFPAAIPLGPWSTGWAEKDIRRWLQCRKTAK
ncbi:MAG: helix-turn-helix transcriptional regulator [Gammaproteobacteria bacterium]